MRSRKSLLGFAIAAIALSQSWIASAAPPLEPLLEGFAGRFFMVETREGADLATLALGRPISTEKDYLRFVRMASVSGLNGAEADAAAERIARLRGRMEEAAGSPQNLDGLPEPLSYVLARSVAGELGLSAFGAESGEFSFVYSMPRETFAALRNQFLEGVATGLAPGSELARLVALDQGQLSVAQRLTRGTAILANGDGELALELATLERSHTPAQAAALERALQAGSDAERATILGEAGFTPEQRAALERGGVVSRGPGVAAAVRLLGRDDERALDALRRLVVQREEMFPGFSQEFNNQVRVDLPGWTGPGEMPFRSSYERVLRVFQDPAETYRLIMDLEKDVMITAERENLSRESALQKVLADWEREGGFKPMIRLEPRVYSPDQFNAMLREGALFQDPTFMNGNHGEETHRIQWNLVMRDMQANPQFYRTASGRVIPAVRLYTNLGEPQMATGLQPGSRSVWDHLFDSFNRNATHPEFFKPTRRFWPEAGNWR